VSKLAKNAATTASRRARKKFEKKMQLMLKLTRSFL